MNLLDNNGRPIKPGTTPNLVDGQGDAVSSSPEPVATTKDIGLQLCNHLLTKAQALPQNELINKQFDILYHAALNILAHRIVNVGLGMEEGNAIAEWDNSRAFAHEKETQENLTVTVEEWKTKFFDGDLYYNPGRPT